MVPQGFGHPSYLYIHKRKSKRAIKKWQRARLDRGAAGHHNAARLPGWRGSALCLETSLSMVGTCMPMIWNWLWLGVWSLIPSLLRKSKREKEKREGRERRQRKRRKDMVEVELGLIILGSQGLLGESLKRGLFSSDLKYHTV